MPPRRRTQPPGATAAAALNDPRCLQVGKVLRVRKPQAHCATEQAALEDEVWGPMLGCIAADSGGGAAAAAAVAREQRYVQQVLAPLLGPHHIPPQEPVAPSASFLQQLLTASGCLPDCDGGNGGYGDSSSGSPAAGLATLMPDVTLLPDGLPICTAAATATATSPSSSTSSCGMGPVMCIELKPKCGFISSCGTVHPDNRPLKHSRSRYQLHQMLKLAQVRGSPAPLPLHKPQLLHSGTLCRMLCRRQTEVGPISDQFYMRACIASHPAAAAGQHRGLQRL